MEMPVIICLLCLVAIVGSVSYFIHKWKKDVLKGRA